MRVQITDQSEPKTSRAVRSRHESVGGRRQRDRDRYGPRDLKSAVALLVPGPLPCVGPWSPPAARHQSSFSPSARFSQLPMPAGVAVADLGAGLAVPAAAAYAQIRHGIWASERDHFNCCPHHHTHTTLNPPIHARPPSTRHVYRSPDTSAAEGHHRCFGPRRRPRGRRLPGGINRSIEDPPHGPWSARPGGGALGLQGHGWRSTFGRSSWRSASRRSVSWARRRMVATATRTGST